VGALAAAYSFGGVGGGGDLEPNMHMKKTSYNPMTGMEKSGNTAKKAVAGARLVRRNSSISQARQRERMGISARRK
jgi:hypothetical protein